MIDNLGGRDRQVRGAGNASQGGPGPITTRPPHSQRGGIRNRPASNTRELLDDLIAAVFRIPYASSDPGRIFERTQAAHKAAWALLEADPGVMCTACSRTLLDQANDPDYRCPECDRGL